MGKKQFSGRNGFTWLFLPIGYPQSVSKSYLTYQTWDTAQAFCGNISAIIATQEMLGGVGIMNSTLLAVTIMWMLKEGCWHLGHILFTYTHSKYLDAYSKSWRLYADILNIVAMFIEVTLPYYGHIPVFAICTSTVMKFIAGVAGGATRIPMTQHHALIGNFADVSAKDWAQKTAVNSVASLVSLLIIGYVGSPMLMFMLMVALHIAFNYLAVRAVCLKTFNEPRFLLFIEQHLKHYTIAAPAMINKMEPILPHKFDRHLLNGFEIKLGSSIKDVIMNMDGGRLMSLRYMYSERPYVLVVDICQRNIHVLIKQAVAADAVLCAYFHAVLLAQMTYSLSYDPYDTRSKALNALSIPKHKTTRFEGSFIYSASKIWNNLPPPMSSDNFKVMMRMQDRLANFQVKNTKAGCDAPNTNLVVHPSDELHCRLLEKIAREWAFLLISIKEAGWDVSRHLLVMGCWRITDTHTHTRRLMNCIIQDVFLDA